MRLIKGVLIKRWKYHEDSWSIQWKHLGVFRAATRKSRDLKDDLLGVWKWYMDIQGESVSLKSRLITCSRSKLAARDCCSLSSVEEASFCACAAKHACQDSSMSLCTVLFAHCMEKHSYYWSSLHARVVWKDLSPECCQLLQTSLRKEMLTQLANQPVPFALASVLILNTNDAHHLTRLLRFLSQCCSSSCSCPNWNNDNCPASLFRLGKKNTPSPNLSKMQGCRARSQLHRFPPHSLPMTLPTLVSHSECRLVPRHSG